MPPALRDPRSNRQIHMFKYYLYKIAHFVANRLSLEVSYKVAVLISDLHYFFSFRDRRAVRNNLRKILPPGEDLNAATREVFRNFGKYLSEFLRMEKMVDKSFIEKKIKIRNAELIQQALDAGKGGIIVTAHIGNWEMGAVVLSLGYPLTAVALPHKERPVNDLFNYQREAKGMTVVPTHEAIRRCMESLKDNHLVALVADRDFSSKGGEVMDFLGQKALIPKGPAMFCKRTGAPIIPTFLMREPDGTFMMTLGPLILPEAETQEMSERDSVLRIMRRYLDVIEGWIRRYPTQWLMFREFDNGGEEKRA